MNEGIAGFIDTETTGLNSFDHEVIEFTIVLFRFDRDTGEILGIVDEYTGQREPMRSIPEAASKVHGIYKRHLKGKALDIDRITSLATQCEFFVAHNAEFDRDFVGMTGRDWYCSMSGINWRRHGYKSRALQSLLARHDIDPGQAHRSSSDVHAAIQLLSTKNPDGMFYFRELLDNDPLFPAMANKVIEQEVAEQEVAATNRPIPDDNGQPSFLSKVMHRLLMRHN